MTYGVEIRNSDEIIQITDKSYIYNEVSRGYNQNPNTITGQTHLYPYCEKVLFRPSNFLSNNNWSGISGYSIHGNGNYLIQSANSASCPLSIGASGSTQRNLWDSAFGNYPDYNAVSPLGRHHYRFLWNEGSDGGSANGWYYAETRLDWLATGFTKATPWVTKPVIPESQSLSGWLNHYPPYLPKLLNGVSVEYTYGSQYSPLYDTLPRYGFETYAEDGLCSFSSALPLVLLEAVLILPAGPTSNAEYTYVLPETTRKRWVDISTLTGWNKFKMTDNNTIHLHRYSSGSPSSKVLIFSTID